MNSALAIVAVAALLTAGAAVGIGQLQTRVDFVDAVPASPEVDAYRAMLDDLEGVDFIAVYMPLDPASGVRSLRSDEGFDALVMEQRALSVTLEKAHPGAFQHFLSVYEAMRAGNYMFHKFATGGNPPADAYALPDRSTWDAVRDQVRSGSVDDVLAADGSSALLLAFIAPGQDPRALAGAAAGTLASWSSTHHGVTHDHQPSGLHYASWYTDERNRSDVTTWGIAAAAGVTLALLWVTRRATNALIAVTSLAAATAWTFGAMGLLGIRISFLTVFLAPLVIGVGVDHAVHLLHRYEEERRRGTDRRRALALATRLTRPAILLAAWTTAAGMAVLAFVPSPLFAEIGIVAAVGMVLAAAAALLVAPALRALLPDRPRPRRQDRGLQAWSMAAARRKGLIIGLVAMTSLGAGVVAATSTVVESGTAENEFPEDDPVIVLQHRIEAEYGKFERAYLIVQGDLTRPDALRAIHAATADATDLPLALDASSVTDLLLADEATDEGVLDALLAPTGPEDEADRLPQTRPEARQSLEGLFQDPLWRTLAPFVVSRDLDLTVVAVRLEPWGSQQELVELREALQVAASALDASLGTGYQVHAGGAPVNRAAVVQETPSNVALATAGVAGVVVASLAFAWRRRGLEGLRVAALGGVLVLVAATWLLAAIPLLDGAHGLVARLGGPHNKASLTDMFLLAFAVTVAVGIDDLVHLASRFWEARDAGESPHEAVETAFQHAGRAITGTSLTTFVGFAVLGGIYFLASKNLAILTAFGVASAYILTILLAPAILLGRARHPAAARRLRQPEVQLP